MEARKNDVVNEREDVQAGREKLEQLIRGFEAGEYEGVVVSYLTKSGRREHAFLGSFADGNKAAMDQTRELDMAAQRLFFGFGS